MKNLQLRFILSALALFSIWMTATVSINAAPVRFEQIRQIINARPGKAATAAFEQLRVIGDDPPVKNGGDTPTTAQPATTEQQQTTQTQDGGRVITETTSEIVEDDVCDCLAIPTPKGAFPYALLGLGAVPFLFLIPRGKNTPTPTPTTPTTETPTPPTTETPTPTPTLTPTPPPTTPTPPEPVPEPMTILLFGTGLASVGMAARKRLGKQDKTDDAPDIQ